MKFYRVGIKNGLCFYNFRNYWAKANGPIMIIRAAQAAIPPCNLNHDGLKGAA